MSSGEESYAKPPLPCETDSAEFLTKHALSVYLVLKTMKSEIAKRRKQEIVFSFFR